MDRNQTKVTIPDAVADEIETYRSAGVSNSAIISDVLDGNNTESYVETLRSIPFDTLLSALVNGYEREKTEEEITHGRIKETYHQRMLSAKYSGHAHESMRHTSFIDGMKYILNELGVIIDGVNNVKTEVSTNEHK